MDVSAKYFENSVSTQERCKLIVMLYEGAIKFLNVAKQKIHEEDYALKGVYIGKAQDIIAELNNSLDMETGQDLAHDLRALYNFLYRYLNEANIERDIAKIDDCIRILDELRAAWEEIAASPQVAAAEPVEHPEHSGDGFEA